MISIIIMNKNKFSPINSIIRAQIGQRRLILFCFFVHCYGKKMGMDIIDLQFDGILYQKWELVKPKDVQE